MIICDKTKRKHIQENMDELSGQQKRLNMDMDPLISTADPNCKIQKPMEI